MRIIAVQLLLPAILLLAGTSTVRTQDLLPELVRRIKPSAVSIETFDAGGKSISRGSGFFLAPDRIITNRHVIEKSSRVEIHLNNGRKYTASGILAIDGEGDLALLKVAVPDEFAIPLPLVSITPEEGESVVVVGNPYGLEGSVSDGIVSAVREIPGYGKIIQITAPISPGSSGSPVVNMRGEVIGVATLQASEGQSLNFAVPAERISRLNIGEVRSFAAVNDSEGNNNRALAERLYSRGLALLSSDDFEKAVPYFEQAVRTDPSYAEAWYQVGFCYGMIGKHNESLRASRKAAELRPEWPETFLNIGASSFALEEYEDAADAYRSAARLDQTNADTQFALGLTYEKLERKGETILAFKRAVSLKPDHVRAMERLGVAYFGSNRFADAIEVLEQLKSYKSDSETYNLLGECHLAQENFDDSIDAFSTAIGMDPAAGRIRYNLGRAYLKSGNRSMARLQYEILEANQSEWADRLLVLLDP